MLAKVAEYLLVKAFIRNRSRNHNLVNFVDLKKGWYYKRGYYLNWLQYSPLFILFSYEWTRESPFSPLGESDVKLCRKLMKNWSSFDVFLIVVSLVANFFHISIIFSLVRYWNFVKRHVRTESINLPLK